MRNLGNGNFYITTISRDELNGLGFDADKISDWEMEELADSMAHDYLEQLYWSSLRIIAGEIMRLPKKSSEADN